MTATSINNAIAAIASRPGHRLGVVLTNGITVIGRKAVLSDAMAGWHLEMIEDRATNYVRRWRIAGHSIAAVWTEGEDV